MSRRFIKLMRVPLVLGFGLLMMLGVVFSREGFAQGVNDARTDNNWIDQSMELLAMEGLIKDYPIDWVQAGHALERSEIAYYLKQTVLQFESEKRDLKLSARVIEVFHALVLEFQKELADLGIKATDINKISPNPISLKSKPDDYQDLDLIIEPRNNKDIPQSYYYYGHYYSELQRKSFFFIPSDFITTYDINQLEVNNGVVNILYQTQLSSSFLVLKGSLPTESQPVKGYYLFPITGIQDTCDPQTNTIDSGQNRSILTLLDEVNQLQQVDSLLRYNGSLNLSGFKKLNVNLLDEESIGDLDQGLTVGGLLIYSNNSLLKANQIKDFGLPVFNSRQTSLITPVDLDLINSKSLQSLQINIQGTVEITPQTSLFGGLDLFYQNPTIHLDDLWPSDAKASAGVTFYMNDYWSFLTYQSLVNSQNKEGWFSTTSVGVEYNKWITLWLAYQFLEIDNPILIGTLSFRF